MNQDIGKKIVIIGLGITGLSCINYFLSKKIKIRVLDTRNLLPNIHKILPKKIIYNLGSLNHKWLKTAEIIIISPSISLMQPALIKARKNKIKILIDIELFIREIAKSSIVAIKGSNGKSTVTTLVGNMAKEAGWNIGIGGNIGFPVLNLLQNLRQLYIIELSSLQLEYIKDLQITSAIILNLSENHLARYPFGVYQYYCTKLQIYQNAKYCIVNMDDQLTIPNIFLKKSYITFGTNKKSHYSLSSTKKNTWISIYKKKF